MKEIGKVIRQELFRRDLTPADLVRMTDLGRATIDRVLEGKGARPRAVTLKVIAEALDLAFDVRTGQLLKEGQRLKAGSIHISQDLLDQLARLARAQGKPPLAFLREVLDLEEGRTPIKTEDITSAGSHLPPRPASNSTEPKQSPPTGPPAPRTDSAERNGQSR